MTISDVSPNLDRAQWLDGAQFADAFRITINENGIDARGAAMRMFGHSPRWVEALIALRNLLVAPFGLKRSGAGDRHPEEGGPGHRGTRTLRRGGRGR